MRRPDRLYESALRFDGLVKNGCRQKALARTLRKLGQSKIASGQYACSWTTKQRTVAVAAAGALNGSALQSEKFVFSRKNRAAVGV
jgi:PmbA protein